MKNMWCIWSGAWVYTSVKEHRPGRVVLEGCFEWKEPKLACSICPFGVNILYPNFLPKRMSWLAPEGSSIVG